MSWGNPTVLWALLGPLVIVAALLVLTFLGRRGVARLPGVTRAVATAGRIQPVSAARATRRPWLLVLALTLGITALARPRWGTVETPVTQKAREVMIALDLSRSMTVDDVPPTRLARAKLLVQGLLEGLRGERVGLVVFAGTAFVQVPLSPDYQILDEFLPELNPNYMPQGGTDYDGMLKAALGGFNTAADTDHYLIVLSDGEDTGDGWRERLPELKKRNVRAITLGLGTEAGGFIPDEKRGGFIKDERGAVVLSRLDPTNLRALADETGGAYRDAAQWVDLPALLAETVERGRAGDFGETTEKQDIERFPWLLTPAFILGLLGLWREIGTRPGTRQIRREPTNAATATTTAALISILAVVAAFPLQAAVTDTTPAAPADQLKKTIGRLSSAPAVPAEGWRTFAEQTIAAAQAAADSGTPLSEGTITDALEGVDLGERLEKAAAPWDELRASLRRFVCRPDPPPKQEPEKKPEEQKSDDESKKNPSPQDSKQEPEQKPDANPQSQDKPPQEPEGSDSSDAKNNDGRDNQPPSSDGANAGKPGKAPPSASGSELGDLDDATPTEAAAEKQPPPQPTRKFGGRPAGTPAPPPTDPEKAAALARLRQVTDQDSPGRLFQLLEDKTGTPAARGRDW